MGKKKKNNLCSFFCPRTALVTLDASLESAPDDLVLADAPALRRQVRSVDARITPFPTETGPELGA